MVYRYTLRVTPTNLKDLYVITEEKSYWLTLNDFSDEGSYLESDVVGFGTEITVASSGYITQTVEWSSGVNTVNLIQSSDFKDILSGVNNYLCKDEYARAKLSILEPPVNEVTEGENLAPTSDSVYYAVNNRADKSLSNLTTNGYQLLFKPGMLIPFAGSSAPAGWLICDGSAVSRTTYSALFAVIGTTYGTGDGSTTFNLPNFVNKTFWGGSTSGTVKSAGLPDIQGTIGGGAGYDGASGGGLGVLRDTEVSGAFTASKVKQYQPAKGSAGWGGTDGNARQTATFKASNSNPIYGSSSTVQPPAIQTLVIIKY